MKQQSKKYEFDIIKSTQVEPGSNCSSVPKEEVTYLKKTVRTKHELRDSSVKETMKKIVEVGHKKTPSSNASALGLSFVQVTICGRKFAMLIDI